STPTTIRVQSQAALITRAGGPTSVSLGNPVAPTDVQLANKPPEIVSVITQMGGALVQTAAPGETISLIAGTRDLNGDPLQFEWSTLPGNGTVSPAAAGTANWTLPTFAGHYTVTAHAAPYAPEFQASSDP